MRVVCFGTYNEQAHPRTRVLREGLAAAAVDVDVVNVSLNMTTAARIRLLEQPFRLPLLALRILSCWTVLIVRRLRLRGPVDAVLVGYLGHFDVILARMLFPRTTIVLDYLVSAADTAHDRRLDGGVVLALLEQLDRLACRAADLVLVDTPENLATVPAPALSSALVVPVGAPEEWFTEPPGARDPGPLRIIFYGLFTPLQGAPVLLRGLALAAEAGLEFNATLVGTGQDHAAAVAAAPEGDITWIDWVAPHDLPDLVRAHDLCVGILGDTPKSLRVVPNKAYQGAAAGCLVVTSDTAPQRRELPDATVFVTPGDAAAFAASMCALPDPDELLAQRRRSQLMARENFAPLACASVLLRSLRTGHVS